MNTSLIKSALAMTAAFAVGSAFATETPIYGATFEQSASQSVPLNDQPYMPGSITNCHNNGAGWYAGSADDASQIISGGAATGTQALKLQTEGGTLTNVFNSTVKDAINAARTGEGTNLVFEAQVKFVASDSLETEVVEAGQDAKFALFAYAEDGGNSTNLVVVHKNLDGVVVNEKTNVEIDTDDYQKVVVEYFSVGVYSFFTVKVGEGAGETLAISTNAWSEVDLELGDDTTMKYFNTINGTENSTDIDISSLCFKGTGEVDDISIKSVVEEPVVSDISFTFNLGTGVTGATVTIDGTPYVVTDATTNIAVAASLAGQTATISAVTYSDWYIAADDAITSFTVADQGTFTVTAKQAAATDVTGKQASDFGITTGGFASADETTLAKVIGWAEANGVSVSDVNDMTFSNPAGSTNAEKAYLLGISPATYAANPAAAEAEAVAALEIASIEYVNGAWVIKSQNNKGDGDALLNGHIDIYGATTLAGPWAPDTVDAKFFKAVLVK